jgi:hypothetical protein
MVEQGSEPFLPSFPCCFSHTVQPLGHALPALCRVHVWLHGVLLHLCPSLPNLRQSVRSFVRLVHRYYGTVRLLQHVRVRIAVYGLRGPAYLNKQRRARDLPVLVHVVSLACAGSIDYAGPDNHSRISRLPYCLPPTHHGVGILNCDFSKLDHPAHQFLCSTLQAPPHDDTCKTRGQDGFATSFPVGLLHPLQHAGLSRRSVCCRQLVSNTVGADQPDRKGQNSGWGRIV